MLTKASAITSGLKVMPCDVRVSASEQQGQGSP